MASGLKSAEEYRAMASLCRQQAACDPDRRWQLLGDAEHWEYLASAEARTPSLKDRGRPRSGRHSSIGSDNGTSLKARSL
jgi:hypothetical protein